VADLAYTRQMRDSSRGPIVLTLVLSLACGVAQAQQKDPWEYHGIRLGARMTQDQIMHALGANQYVKDPQYDPWNNSKGCATKPDQKVCKEADFYQYGTQAFEKEEFDIGPSCETKRPGYFDCVNPQVALTTPDWSEKGHGVTRVVVFVREGVVSTIDIFFDSLNADEFFEIVHRKFGTAGWVAEHQQVSIGNVKEPHEWQKFDRTTETKKTSTRSAMMTDYDGIFTHRAAPGPLYLGVLEMKLLDQDL
jgi:hypothetical protein